MNRPRLIETFNTHLMTAVVIQAVKTARDLELEEVMQAVRQAASQPQQTAQPMIVYGERGSGKSFLMRLIEIEIKRLAKEEDLAVVPALLPEEQYNIRSAPQLIQTIAAKVRGAGWEAAAFAMDFRPQAEAWDAAVADLNAALDQRFGEGQGLVVAMVENFDSLTRSLFGSGAAMQNKIASAKAIEQNAAEQLLRKLMNTQGSRLMLIATATGTVDQDYDRPLFQAFKTLDLRIWNSDDCIEYFNRRRALENQPDLSPAEEARARAIAEFIGGNPRLAQLLGEVLASPDARKSAALLDALIRKGEPCTQTELAARVGATSQAQIADAFSYLLSGRLLVAGSDKAAAGRLYRVRDRLFVHFYRRRYGEPEQALGLAPIAELLESFFTQREREEQMRRHLEAGEWAEARLFALNSPFSAESKGGFCWYRDEEVTGTPSELFQLAGLNDNTEALEAQTELKDNPGQAVKRWKDMSDRASSPLSGTAALLLMAKALCRFEYGIDNQAELVLENALQSAVECGDKDSQALALVERANFSLYRRNDQTTALDLTAQAGKLVGQIKNDKVRTLALLARAWNFSTAEVERREEAIADCDEAAALAEKIGSKRLLARAFRGKASALNQLARYVEAAEEAEKAAGLAKEKGAIHSQIEAQAEQGRALFKLGKHEDAESVHGEASGLARDIGDRRKQSRLLWLQAQSLRQLNRPKEGLDASDEAARLAADLGDIGIQAKALFTKGQAQIDLGGYPNALATLDQAEQLALRAGNVDLQLMLVGILPTVADKGVWDEFTACVLRHPQAPTFLMSPRAFDEVGRVWSKHVKDHGRAQAYASISRQLSSIVQLILFRQPATAPKAQPDGHLRSLINGLVNHCDDAGFLQDMAGLLREGFGEKAEPEIQRLQIFAGVRAAPDKEKVLQRLDPDLAYAIRRILGLPEPDDLLAQKGRRKGR